jgi:Domain of unknown function (DUF4259)
VGAWDAGPFDNDTAADFAGDLDDAAEHDRVAMIHAVLMTAIETDGYLDLDDGAPAVAAAALVACRLTGGEQFLPNNYGPDEPILGLPPSFIPLAISAVDRVLGDNSELAELWAEGTQEPHPWQTSMRRMKAVLLAATTNGMDPLFEAAP